MTFDTIFFIGPQGSGKGTQARLLAEQLGFFYWEMGAIFREISKSETELGKKVAGLINQGALVTDDIVLEMVKHKLSEIPKGQGIIFDGVPRTLPQADFLIPCLHEMEYKSFVTLFIDLPRTESVSRLLKRAETEHRTDDTEEKINFRLDQYERDTLPVLDYLKKCSTFISIDGKPSIEQVTAAISAALKAD
jgi:adenylate kinase